LIPVTTADLGGLPLKCTTSRNSEDMGNEKRSKEWKLGTYLANKYEMKEKDKEKVEVWPR